MAPSKIRAIDLIHGDAAIGVVGAEVAPPISVTSTFRQPNPDLGLGSTAEINLQDPQRHVYSRVTQQVSTRAEQVLSRIMFGFALTYSSGLASCNAALVHYKPKRIAIITKGGYHGTHGAIRMYKRAQVDLEVIELDDEYKPGDLCWLETPLNPTGEVSDIQYYADKIHKVGGKLVIDATFGPPPLQDPFKFGADCVMHSGTKYLGGHSDLLCGVLVVKTSDEWNELIGERTYLGSVMGSLEAWLLLRSLRTLHLRVARQSESATILVPWLKAISSTPSGSSYDGAPGGIIEKVTHSSLQGTDSRGFEPSKQMEGGWNATFALILKKLEHAAQLPHLLNYFVAATSLGGVESLAEHRFQTDPGADPRIVRLSIGVEDVEDLKDDLRQALQKLKEVV